MNPRSKRRHIKELAAKLHFLALDPEAQKRNGCSGVTSLAKGSGINVSTLKTLKSKANADLISPEHEEAFAKTTLDQTTSLITQAQLKFQIAHEPVVESDALPV